METDSTKEVQAYNLIETPWYFGAYLNMARHNMFLLINHLTEKFSYLNGEKLTNDEEICTTKHLLVTIFDPVQTIYEDERFKVYKYLVKRHYLPFIKIFHEKNGYQLDSNPIVDYKGLHNFLLSVFNSLNSCRNSFTHYLSVDNTGKKIDERKPILDKNMKSTLEQLFKLAPTFSLKRFEASHEENDFDHLNLYELFHPDSSQLTEHGFYFFINLFLERSYAIKFLKKIRGFKNDSTPSFRATIQAFTAYSLRIPDVKLDVEDKKLSLLLEMLNELQRCPKELHSHLSDEDRKIFQPSLDEKDKSNILLNSTDYENIKDEDIDSLISEITSLRRESNRFPYFALRFIDEFDLLPHIRFQITLGKLHVKSYEKIITGNKKNRRIVETIQAFGKLSDFEHSEDEILRDLQEVGVIEKGCYFEQYAPHYNMENNQLPFYLFDDKKTMKYPSTPTGFISLNDLPKIVILAKLFPVDSKSKKCKVEDIIKDFIEIDKTCYLNYDELQKIKQQLSLIPEEFTRRIIQEKSIKGRNGKPDYLNLHKEINLLTRLNKSKEELCLLTSDELRKLTRDRKELEYINQIRYLHFLDKRKQELQKYLPNGLLVNQLPEQITRYLLNINEPDTEKTIDQKIKAVYDDCNIRLKRIKKETEKPQYEQNIKLGELATFLARDIIKMVVDKDVKQKITSPYYNNLQNKIAYFSISQSEIIALCNELQLFDNNKGHVFLSRQLINESKGIIDFYKNYLECKCKWITTHLSKEEAIPLSLLKIKEKVGRNDFNHWLSNKSTMPVSLPNTLFDKDVSTYLSKELHKNRMPFNQGDKFSILLSKFLQQDTQPFYCFKRIYFVNGEPKEIDINDLDGKTLKSRYGKQVEKNEKQIRFIQTQDRIIKLLCEHILSEYNSDSHHKSLKLASIVPFSEESPLNNPFQFKQRIIRKGNETYFTVIAKDNQRQLDEISAYSQLTTEDEKNSFKGQKGYEWTVKDFGRFKKMTFDRRISSLSSYFENKEVTFKFLDYQLKEYDKYREFIFESTFQLEQHICDIALEDIIRIEMKHRTNDNNFNNVQFNKYTEWIEDKGLLNEDKICQLKKIRNGFSHSQFPNNVSGIPKITQLNINQFEEIYGVEGRKGEIENLNLSLSKLIFEDYKSIINNIIPSVIDH